MNRLLLTVLVVAVAGCQPRSSTAEIPWEGDLPDNATVVSDDELAQLREQGQLVPIDAEEREALRERERQRDTDARALLDAWLADHPSMAGRFDLDPDPEALELPDGNFVTTLDSGEDVVLMGNRHRTRDIAATLRAAEDRGAQQSALTLLYPTMPPRCRDAIAAPDAWSAMDAPALRGAMDQLTDCFAEMADGDDPDLPVDAPLGSWPAGGFVDSELSQLTTDTQGNCFEDAADPSTYKHSDAPLDGFPYSAPYVGRVRSQGTRGTCVAFATASAMEFYVARRYGRSTNLSEQAIYALGKAIFYDQWGSDGLNTVDFLHDLADSDLAMPFEPKWPYNPSWGKLEDSFVGACDGYDFPVCSESPAQTGLVCRQVGGQSFCYIWTAGYSDGYEAPTALELGSFDDDDDLNELKAFLSVGFSAVVSVDVTNAFKYLQKGWWPEGRDDGSSKIGSHALHLLAYRPASGSAAVHPGEGFVLVKNSWGCDWGDNGLAWIPVRWVREHFNSLMVLTAYREGRNLAPEVEILSPVSGTEMPSDGFFPDPILLQARADDNEDGEDCCTFRWWSDKEGTLGVGETLEHAFTGAGVHVIRAYATDSEGKESYDQALLVLTNQPPSVDLIGPVRVYQGFTEIWTAETADNNDAFGIPCSAHTWSSTDPADGVTGHGCAKAIAFGTVGFRTLSVVVEDSDGATAIRSLTVEVVPAPPDLEPRVTITTPIDDNQSRPPSTPYVMAAAIDNPGGLALTYQWRWRDRFSGGDLGTQPTQLWTPGQHVSSDCGGKTIDVIFEATDGTTTWTHSRALWLSFPPC